MDLDKAALTPTVRHEREFQKMLVSEWEKAGNWGQSVSVSNGMVSGFPDCVFNDGHTTFFAEVKVGSVDADRSIRSRNIRPSQIRWAKEALRAGVRTGLVVGVYYPIELRERREWLAAVVSNDVWLGGGPTIFDPAHYELLPPVEALGWIAENCKRFPVV